MSNLARKPAELFVDPAVILEARPDGTRLFRSKLELPGFGQVPLRVAYIVRKHGDVVGI